MEFVALAVPSVIFLVSVVAVLRLPREQSASLGVMSAISMAVLVPSFATSAPVAVAAVLGTVTVLVIAIARDRGPLRTVTYPVALILFIVWSSTVGSIGSPIKLVLLNLGTGALLILLVLAVVIAVSRGQNFCLPFFAIVLVFEFLIGFAEQFFGWKAMWPRADGTDNISHRVNAIAPILVGRSMGSAAQPIPYGMLIAFCVIVCLWFAVRNRSRTLWILVAVGLVGMVFAGTRSAFVALAVALAVLALTSIKWRRATLIAAAVAVLSLVVAAGGVVAYLSRSGALTTDSFIHRAGILGTAGGLLTRNPPDVIFGSGYQSVETLLKSGVVRGAPGIYVFDEEFIRTLACLGVIGLALLVATFVRGIAIGNGLSRTLTAFIAVSFFTFDGFSWRVIDCLLVISIAAAYGRPRESRATPRWMTARQTLRLLADRKSRPWR